MQSMNETCRRSTTTVRRPLARPASSAPSSSGAVERSTSPSACTTNTPPRSSTATASGVPASSKSASKSASRDRRGNRRRNRIRDRRGRWENGRAGRAVAGTPGSGDRVDEASEELEEHGRRHRGLLPGRPGFGALDHRTDGVAEHTVDHRLSEVDRSGAVRGGCTHFRVVVVPRGILGFHRDVSVRRSLASCSARPPPRQGAPHAHCLPGIGMDRRGGGHRSRPPPSPTPSSASAPGSRAAACWTRPPWRARRPRSPATVGFLLHGINGEMVFPLLVADAAGACRSSRRCRAASCGPGWPSA